MARDPHAPAGREAGPGPAPAPVPRTIRVAQLVVALQAVALLLTAVALLIATAIARAHRLWIALSLAGLAVLAALVLALCARGLGREAPAARTPVVLIELLCLPVGYSLGVQAGRIAIGGPILAAAITVLATLFSPSARARLRDAPDA